MSILIRKEQVLRYVNILKLADSFGLKNRVLNGKNLFAACPFHKEEKPSFNIVIEGPNKGVWHCFGCGLKGDLFSFVQRLYNFSFKQALEHIALLSGVSSFDTFDFLEFIQSEVSKTFEPINTNRKENNQVKYYPLYYNKPKIPSFYLSRKRKFSTITSKKIVSKYNIGTVIKRGKPIYIGMKLKNEDGKVVSEFLQGLQKNIKRFAKGSKIGNILFDLNDVKSRVCILTESIWDTIKVRSFGFPSTTSFRCGLTEKQITIILRKFDEIWIAFDNDLAGRRGTNEIKDTLNPFIKVFDVKMPLGKNDPCECNKKEFVLSMVKAGWKF